MRTVIAVVAILSSATATDGGDPPAPPGDRKPDAMQAFMAGDYASVEAIWQAEVDRLKADPNRVEYGNACYMVGTTRLLRYDYVGAERSLRAADAVYRAARPPLPEWEVQDNAKLLARAVSEVGKFREAEELYADWWAFERRRGRAAPPDANLAHLYWAAGRLADAEPSGTRRPPGRASGPTTGTG